MTTTQPTEPSGRLPTQGVGILLVVVSAVSFGSGALFVQPLYDDGMETPVVLFWRFAVAAIASWLFLSLRRRTRRSLVALPRRRVLVLLLLGALYVGNSFAYFAALQVVPISLTSIITYLYPAIVAIVGARFVRRLEGRRAWVALGLSILGVALAVGGIPAGELPPLWGLALAFANAAIYATWIVLQARLTGDRPVPAVPPADAETVSDVPDPAAAAALMTTATAIVYAGLTQAVGGSISPVAVAPDLWLPLLGLGLVATAIAIQTFYAGVRRVGAARASIISTVEPVWTIAMAMLLFGESLTPMQVVGGVVVLGAVILAESGGRAPAPSTAGARAG